MKLKKAYKVMQENCGIEIGDTVRVLRKASDFEMGWSGMWQDAMNNAVRGEFEVLHIEGGTYKLLLHGISWYFPFFVLQKVEPTEVIDEPLAVGQWFEGENGCKYTIIKIYNQFALSDSNGNLCICPVNLINDVFDSYKWNFKRIKTPFQVTPK